MTPKMKLTNARTFPATSTVDLIRSDNANVTSKHIAEKKENKHANVTKAFAAMAALQVLIRDDEQSQLVYSVVGGEEESRELSVLLNSLLYKSENRYSKFEKKIHFD